MQEVLEPAFERSASGLRHVIGWRWTCRVKPKHARKLLHALADRIVAMSLS
jgi:hypothetical protein